VKKKPKRNLQHEKQNGPDHLCVPNRPYVQSPSDLNLPKLRVVQVLLRALTSSAEPAVPHGENARQPRRPERKKPPLPAPVSPQSRLQLQLLRPLLLLLPPQNQPRIL
jgi:hypothetical protein